MCNNSKSVTPGRSKYMKQYCTGGFGLLLTSIVLYRGLWPSSQLCAKAFSSAFDWMRSSYSVLLAFAWPLAMRGLPCLDDKKRRRSFIFYPLEAIKALASDEPALAKRL